MIAVSEEKLAKALGFIEWAEPLHNDHQRMAARVITDSHDQKHADVALGNATVWIKMAYDSGQAAGIALERGRWHRKLSNLFGIPHD